MGKLIKKIIHGVDEISERSGDLLSGPTKRAYYKPLESKIDYPKSVTEAMARDSQKIFRDINIAFDKANK